MIIAKSDRLVLRELKQRDAEDIFLLNSDPEVLKHVHDVPFADLDTARAWIANIKQRMPDGIGRWAIETNDGDWIGRCSLRRQQDGEVLMGYRLLREHWGKGHATECARLLIELAFNKHRLPYIAAKVARLNIASQRVMEKNGGRFWKHGNAENFAETLVYRFDRG